jgi:hypothetical protein
VYQGTSSLVPIQAEPHWFLAPQASAQRLIENDFDFFRSVF